jgi:hypothetical protein
MYFRFWRPSKHKASKRRRKTAIEKLKLVGRISSQEFSSMHGGLSAHSAKIIASRFYFILHLLYDVIDIPFNVFLFRGCE